MPGVLAQESGPPLALADVVNLLQSGVTPARLEGVLALRCVTFDHEDALVRETLREAGAGVELFTVLTERCPTAAHRARADARADSVRNVEAARAGNARRAREDSIRQAAAARADSVAKAAEDVSAAPTVTPFTVPPRLRNPAEVQSILRLNYPPFLRDAGIGGTVNVWVFIEKDGTVRATRIQESSGHRAMDDAGEAVARIMQFTPAYNDDETVPVWVAIPVSFAVQ